MSTSAPTPKPANAGMLAMRAALAARKAAIAAGQTPPPPKAKPAKARVDAPAPTQSAPDACSHTWRVCVLVMRGDAQTHVWSEQASDGAKRAGAKARAALAKAGETPVAVVATLREDAPMPVLAAAV